MDHTSNNAIPTSIDDDPTGRCPAFADRRAAGRLLARALDHRIGDDALVLGIPRGGVVVADEIAHALGLQLDVWVVRKIAVPFRPELVMGALSEGANLVLDRELIAATWITPAELRRLVHRAAAEIRERIWRYRGARLRCDVRGRTVILVDDGIATDGPIRAAIGALRRHGAGRIVVVAPVGTPEAIGHLAGKADEIVLLNTPARTRGVGAWYEDFHQVPDREVIRILSAPRQDLPYLVTS